MENWYQKMKASSARDPCTVRSCNHVRLLYPVKNTSQTKDPSVIKIHAPPKVIEMNLLQIPNPIQPVYLSLLHKILDLFSRCRNQGKCHLVCPKESNTDALVSSFSKSLSICFVVPL
ncbi:hypothetical protein BDL97_09G095900 [Sphagnum fallax]|nr:hypothetical protein BDL97_09G095900 [Sphagnum fallax]